MIKKTNYLFLLTIIVISFGFLNVPKNDLIENEKFISYIVNPKKQNLEFFWKNENGVNYKNAENLILGLKKKNKKLVFSTNG